MENVYRNCENPVFSIIIPCRKIDAYTNRCIDRCASLPEKLEIIVITDKECAGYPAEKRNLAIKKATGEYFAFIDSDAYPAYNWLTRATIGLDFYCAVCGPGVLPPDASFLEKAADLVFQWLPYSYRVVPRKIRTVTEYPTFNLIVARNHCPDKFENYLTGEDSLFCRSIDGEILYDPLLKVYHSRRELFKPFWRQVGTWGRHRGCLIALALVGWITGVFTYSINFIKGFIRRKP